MAEPVEDDSEVH